MSIVFKPKLSFHFGSGRMQPSVKKTGRPIIHWTANEVENLIELRAIGLSHKDCGRLLNRSDDACIGAVKKLMLNPRIEARKQELINEVLDNDIKRKDSSITATITATA